MQNFFNKLSDKLNWQFWKQKLILIQQKSYGFKLPFVGLCFLIFTIVSLINHHGKKYTPPLQTPVFSPFADTRHSLVVLGIIEPFDRMHSLAAKVPGVVTNINKIVGNQVKHNEIILSIDQSEINAQIKINQSSIETAQIIFEQAKLQFDLVRPYEKNNQFVSKDEYLNRKFSMLQAQAKLNELFANLNHLQVQKDLLNLRSPIDGEILQLNIREGEFAGNNEENGNLVLIGKTDRLQIRAEIDEEYLELFKNLNNELQIKGILRGSDPNKKENFFNLKLIYYEPYVLPKSILEVVNKRVDTRVLQVVYEICNLDQIKSKNINLFVGSQVDVYIKLTNS